MWLSLQQQNPDDYVFATGKTHSVKELIEISFMQIGIRITWVGEGLSLKGINEVTGDVIVEIDSSIYRFSDTAFLRGNPAKAMNKLGWVPKKNFNDIIKLMVKYEFQKIKK